MVESVQNRRSPAETLWLHLLIHCGFSGPLLAEAALRSNSGSFGNRAVTRAKSQIQGRLAHQIDKWPIRPTNRVPGKAVCTTSKLIEISILAASMHYLHGERIYNKLMMKDIILAYDLYTNLRLKANSGAPQISPDNAYWLSQELASQQAIVPYCPKCKVRYYSAIEQRVKNGCPFCRELGIGDY